MTITVNGKLYRPTNAPTIAALVQELKLVPETLLIEHNETALHRAEWPARALNEGDRVEFVRVVAGG